MPRFTSGIHCHHDLGCWWDTLALIPALMVSSQPSRWSETLASSGSSAGRRELLPGAMALHPSMARQTHHGWTSVL